MENLWLVLFWTGPIGVGIFLVCLGAMLYLISKADAISKPHEGKVEGRREEITKSSKPVLRNARQHNSSVYQGKSEPQLVSQSLAADCELLLCGDASQ